jgi:hypothetical protein
MNAEKSAITVRQAVLADLDGLVELFDEYRQFYGRSSNVEAARNFLLDRFNHGESIIFLAEDNARSMGFTQDEEFCVFIARSQFLHRTKETGHENVRR